MNEELKKNIVKALTEGKHISIRRSGEEGKTIVTLSELQDILETPINLTKVEKLRLEKFVNGKLKTFQFFEDSDYAISITIK